jgi:hypothetical protein
MGFALFPRDDPRKVRVGDLQLLYAALKKVKVSPVHLLVSHWFTTLDLIGPIGCTSLITRLAVSLNLLENASLDFIKEARPCFGYESFRHGRMLKRESDRLYMLYDHGKIWLPNPELSIYSMQILLVDL